MEENEAIPAQTEEFQNQQFNSETTQRFMNKRRRNEDFDLNVVYNDIETIVPVHKEILIERCGYFKNMLNPESRFKEANQSSVYLHFYGDFTIFQTFIDYLYSGIIQLKGCNVFGVYTFALYINQEDLIDFCITFLINSISCETLFQIYTFAQSYNISKITADVHTYVDNNFNDVISDSTEVLKWPANFLIQLLSSTKIKVKREETVLKVVCRWLNVAFGEREQFIQELFKKLRFSYMSTIDIKTALHGKECKGMNSKIQRQCFISMSKMEEKSSSSVHPPEEARHYYEGIYCFGVEDGRRVFEHHWPKDKRMPVKSLSLPPQKQDFAELASLNDKLYLSGGFSKVDGKSVILNVVQVYDPKKDQWSNVAPMNIERFGHISCTCDGKIYVFGGTSMSNFAGFGPNKPLLDNEVYDPTTNQWSILPDPLFNKGMNLIGATSVETSIFVLYRTADWKRTSHLMEYKTKRNEWLELPYHEVIESLVGYGSMLFLFAKRRNYLQVVIYDSGLKTFHELQQSPNGLSVTSTFCASSRSFCYHDDKIVLLLSDYSSRYNSTYHNQFVMFDPKVALKTLEGEINFNSIGAQISKQWSCEKMISVNYQLRPPFTFAAIF